MMRSAKSYYILLIAILVLSAGCTDDYSQNGDLRPSLTPPSSSDITTSAYTLQYESYASSYEVTIESETAWTAEVSESWITVTPSRGNAGQSTVSIGVTPNTSQMPRNGYVTIRSDSSDVLEIAIEQKGIGTETGGDPPVSEGGSFTNTGYPEDGNWNNISSGSLSVTITGYTVDQNWSDNQSSEDYMTVEDYGPDADWNNR